MNKTDKYINFVKHSTEPCSVYLTSGVNLEGSIVDFDDVSIFFYGKGVTQMINRASISTIMPKEEFHFDEIPE